VSKSFCQTYGVHVPNGNEKKMFGNMNPPKNYRTKENNNMPFIGLHTTLHKIVISEHHKQHYMNSVVNNLVP
jgi:hypothetical protein